MSQSWCVSSFLNRTSAKNTAELRKCTNQALWCRNDCKTGFFLFVNIQTNTCLYENLRKFDQLSARAQRRGELFWDRHR